MNFLIQFYYTKPFTGNCMSIYRPFIYLSTIYLTVCLSIHPSFFYLDIIFYYLYIYLSFNYISSINHLYLSTDQSIIYYLSLSTYQVESTGDEGKKKSPSHQLKQHKHPVKDPCSFIGCRTAIL